jgi:hypothetical protein
MKNKSVKQTKKEGEYDVPVTGTGTFSVMEECDTICASS